MNVAYVYPWDVVGDPAAPARIASLGVEAVALAASYHSTRAATPYHPERRVLDVPSSAFYLPVRPAAFGRLVPAAPTWTTPDAYLTAASALRAEGLKVLAWTVLTHNSHLGSLHPDLVVRNAFGDPYPYALCPGHGDVLEYCERLVREIVAVGEPDGVVLEACGPMGFGHQSVHEKTAGADWGSELLSLCFCTACAPRYPSGFRSAVRGAIDGGSSGGGSSGGGSGVGGFSGLVLGDAVRDVRVSLSAALRARLLDAAGGLPVTLHATPDPWATGAFAALPYGDPGLDVLVGNCWGDPAADSARLARLGELATPEQRIGAYVLALPPRPADAAVLGEQLAAYAAAGATEFHLYHAGLASPARLTALREALTHLH